MNNITNCRVCQSTDIIPAEKFKPYADLDWKFDMYNCTHCGSRFAIRDESIHYFELLYQKYSLYTTYSFLTNIVYQLIKGKELKKCRQVLASFYSYGAIIKAIEKDSRKPLSIMEVGSSTGFLTGYLNAAGHNCYGVEISEKAVEEAREKFGDFYSTRMPEGKTFDVIFMCGTSGGITEIRQVTDQCLSKLKPGGFMIFNAPNMAGLWEGNVWVSTPPPDVITLYAPQSIVQAFSRPGFRTEYVELDELVTEAMRYTYPITFNSAVQSTVAFKYKGAWQFLLYGQLKELYMFAARLAGKARRKPMEYGLIVRIIKER